MKKFQISGTTLIVLSSLILVFAIPSCGGGGGNSSTDTDTETTTPTQISGVLSLATSSENNRPSRSISNNQVQLINSNGVILALTETESDGSYSFSESIENTSYPLSLKSAVNGFTYSSPIATSDTNITSNINEITTAIAVQFSEGSNKSQESLNAISTLILSNRFGVNDSGVPNISPDIFLSGDFKDSSSLGNILLNVCANSGTNLLEDTLLHFSMTILFLENLYPN